MYLTFLFGIQVIVFQHISYSTKKHNTVLIHLSGLHLFGRSLIRTVSVQKKILVALTIENKLEVCKMVKQQCANVFYNRAV